MLGNHLVANKSIKEGEVILQESPLVMGPAQQTVPVCLGCYVPVDGSYKCPRLRIDKDNKKYFVQVEKYI